MNLEPTEDQQTLAETIGRLLKDRYDHSTRLELLGSELGWSKDMWKRYADLGLLGLPFDEEYGGAGMGFAEVSVVLEEFGKALVLEPYIATIVLAGGLVAATGTDEQKKSILSAISAGESILAFAASEPGVRWSQTDVSTKAEKSGDGWTVSGEKSGVLAGDSADQFVVSASTADGIVGLFLVDGKADGVRRDSYTQQDGLRAANVLFDSAAAQALGDPADAAAAIKSVIDEATAGLCAEAVGAMGAMLNITSEYLKTRVQFGTPIGTFQVLQHRSADMYVSLEQARSMAVTSRLAITEGEEGLERDQTLRAAKVQIDTSARHIGQESIQMHGGIGVTMEYPIGHYTKRLTVIARTFGDTDSHLQAFAKAGGLLVASDTIA